MSHALYRLGRFAAEKPWTVIGAWVALAALVIGMSAGFGRELEDSFAVPGLDSQQAIELLSEAQSDRAGLTAQIVVTPLDPTTTFFESASAQAELAEIQAGAAALEHVLFTTDPAAALAADPASAAQSGGVSADGRVALIRVQYPVIEELSASDLEALKEFRLEIGADSPLQVEMGGDLFSSFQEPETGIGEMIGLVAAVIILLVAFGSVIAMGLPIGMALFGLALGISSMSLINYLVDIPSWAPQMASMIGLGVGIDYALFLVTRHREFLGQGMTVAESVGRSAATAGQAVIFAGGTVVIAILGLAVSGVPFMTAAGIATSVVVLIMVAASITLLPAFLGLAGHRVNGRTSKRVRMAAKADAAAATDHVTPGWERWGSHVANNAWPYAIGVTVLLLALTAPVLSLQLGFPDEGTLPDTRTERRGYDLVAESFGPGVNGPLVIAIDTSQDASQVQNLSTQVLADPGIAAVLPADINTEAGVATIVAFPNTAPPG